MNIRGQYFLRIFIPVSIAIAFASCEKFEGDQTIPSYLRIDTVILIKNPEVPDLGEGGLTHKITDVRIFVNDQFIGNFELKTTNGPLIIPILEQGKQKVTIEAAIKYNGISGTRGPYFFLNRYIDTLELIVDSIIEIEPSVYYKANTDFAWIEDFEEDGTYYGVVLEKSNSSDTNLIIVDHPLNIPELYGEKAGLGTVDNDFDMLEITTSHEDNSGFYIPSNLTETFIELDYNTNILMEVGLFFPDVSIKHPVLIINPTEDRWNKIYVNLTPALIEYKNYDYYNIYIRTVHQPEVDTNRIWLDNLKLVRRN